MSLCSNCGGQNSGQARFCQFCGRELANAAGTSEQRKLVTILFSDVVGSTSLAEQLDAETLRRVMTRFYDQMRGVIERHGGTVAKFIGDAVMAVFGVPRLHEDDAVRGVRAAVEMRDALTALNADLVGTHGVSLSMRTGVNTGEVVVSADAARTDHLVLGDPVNVAARLEQAAGPGEVLIGAPTYDLVRDAVEVEPTGSIDVKGKTDALLAFRVLAIRAGSSRRERELTAPMVGRDRQLRILGDVFQGCVDDQRCHLVTVLGAAGVGKSRLVEEFTTGLDGKALVLRGRCLSYGEGITLLPLEEMVRSALGADRFQTGAHLEDAVRGLLGDSPEAGEIASRLVSLLDGSSRGSLQEGFWAARKLFERLASDRAVVLVFDDVHWAEPALLDLIEHIADWSRGAPIYLACLARPELLDHRPAWGGGKLNGISILLEPLAASDSGTLVRRLLGDSDIPDEVRARITDAAEGNPLFVEEMVAMLVDEQLVRRDGPSRGVGVDLAEFTVPTSIQTIIAARLDRLPAGERSVLERASIEGKLFHVGSVSALSPGADKAGLRDQLMTLVRKDLIRPAEAELAGEEGFRFRHQLIRDMVYESMAKEARAGLHEDFADWLGGRAASGPGSVEVILGYHLEQAYRYRVALGREATAERRLAERAGRLYTQAGESAYNQTDYRAAIALLEKANRLLSPGAEDRLHAGLVLGRALVATGAYSEAAAVLEEVENTAHSLGARRPELLAQVVSLEVWEHMNTEAPFSAQAARSEELERALLQIGDASGAAEAALLRLVALPREERAAESARIASVAREVGDAYLEAEANLWHLVAVFQGTTPASEALEAAERILARPGASLAHRARVVLIRAGLLQMLGRIHEGVAEMERATAIFHDLGLERASSVAFTCGLLALDRGDADLAERLLQAGYDQQARYGEKNRLSSLAASLAKVKAVQGEAGESRRLLDVAKEAASPDDIDTHGEVASVLAILAIGAGRPEEAIEHATRAREITWEMGVEFHRLEILLILADALAAAGNSDRAQAVLREGLARAEAKEYLPMADNLRSRLAALAGVS